MATFKGYLLKAVQTNKIFPQQYIKYDSWESNPNQREEIKAYRNENTRDLTRITAQGMKTAIKFEIRDNLHLADVEVIQKWFRQAESNATERKMDIEFWDDDRLEYRTITAYQANPKFKIKKIINENTGKKDSGGHIIYRHDIIYAGRTVDLVEY